MDKAAGIPKESSRKGRAEKYQVIICFLLFENYTSVQYMTFLFV